MLRGKQLGTLWRVDAIEAGVPGRRAGDAHVHFARRRHRASSATIFIEVVPRTIESSIRIDALALDDGAVGIVLALHVRVARAFAKAG